jgi:hypothetical protein
VNCDVERWLQGDTRQAPLGGAAAPRPLLVASLAPHARFSPSRAVVTARCGLPPLALKGLANELSGHLDLSGRMGERPSARQCALPPL